MGWPMDIVAMQGLKRRAGAEGRTSKGGPLWVVSVLEGVSCPVPIWDGILAALLVSWIQV